MKIKKINKETDFRELVMYYNQLNEDFFDDIDKSELKTEDSSDVEYKWSVGVVSKHHTMNAEQSVNRLNHIMDYYGI